MKYKILESFSGFCDKLCEYAEDGLFAKTEALVELKQAWVAARNAAMETFGVDSVSYDHVSDRLREAYFEARADILALY